jgi:hypothetical protein
MIREILAREIGRTVSTSRTPGATADGWPGIIQNSR